MDGRSSVLRYRYPKISMSDAHDRNSNHPRVIYWILSGHPRVGIKIPNCCCHSKNDLNTNCDSCKLLKDFYADRNWIIDREYVPHHYRFGTFEEHDHRSVIVPTSCINLVFMPPTVQRKEEFDIRRQILCMLKKLESRKRLLLRNLFEDMFEVMASLYDDDENDDDEVDEDAELCQRYMVGDCHAPVNYSCPYLHGQLCERCNKYCLHPKDDKKRKSHEEECEKSPSAVEQGLDQTCGICLEVVLKKEPPKERRFGVLENCAHVFCFSCISKWRQSSSENATNSSVCPICRTESFLASQSRTYIADEEERHRLKMEHWNQFSEIASTESRKIFEAASQIMETTVFI